MAYKNRRKKYQVGTTCHNLSCLLLCLKSWQEEDAILASPKKDSLPHLTILLPLTIKEQKLTKQCFLPSAYQSFTQSSQYRN